MTKPAAVLASDTAGDANDGRVRIPASDQLLARLKQQHVEQTLKPTRTMHTPARCFSVREKQER